MLLAIWLFLLSAIGAEDAVVRDDNVALRSRADPAGVPVRTLARGDRVRVLFSVTNDSGDWCEIAAGADTGYVRCAQLDWPGGKERGTVVPPPPPAPPPPPKAPPRPDPSLRNQLLLHNYNPQFWAERLRFSPDQRAALNETLRAVSLPQCAAEFRAMLIRQGIFDWWSFAMSAERLDKTPEGRAITIQMQLCGDRLLAFWRRFPELLTPRQKAQWESERRLVEPSAGLVESHLRVLFTLK